MREHTDARLSWPDHGREAGDPIRRDLICLAMLLLDPICNSVQDVGSDN